MPRIKQIQKDKKEVTIQGAIKHYRQSDKPSIRNSAEKYGLAYSTLRGSLIGGESRGGGHRRMQVLTEYEENSIVRWCERLDEWGHHARLAVVRNMAQAIIDRRVNRRSLGKHWVSRFLNRHPRLASKPSTRLDRQRALANDSLILKDFYQKVC